jgi:Fe2+ transport system protein FeoA
MRLSDVPIGTSVRIQQVGAQADISRRLRELGLCEEAEVLCIVKGRGSIICGIRSTRIGLDYALAGNITVLPAE